MLEGFLQEQEESKGEDRPLLDGQRTKSDLAEQQLEGNTDGIQVMVWSFKAVQCKRKS